MTTYYNKIIQGSFAPIVLQSLKLKTQENPALQYKKFATLLNWSKMLFLPCFFVKLTKLVILP
jgi:hypothetical protein